jgi:hypothetical protein
MRNAYAPTFSPMVAADRGIGMGVPRGSPVGLRVLLHVWDVG